MVKKLLLPLAIVGIAIAVFFVFVANRPEVEQTESPPITIVVEVQSVRVENTAIIVQSQGTVEPRTRTNLISEVSGQIVEISPAFVAGGFFRQGDLLLRLDSQNYQAAVSRAAVSVASARSLLEQERGQADVAQREWERMTTEKQNQLRAKDLYLRKPQLQEAIARLESAEVDLTQAKNDLNKTSIIAPYDGLVSQKNTDIGQFISIGSSLGEIFAIDYAEVRLPIPENKINYIDLPNAFSGSQGEVSASSIGPEVELISTIGNVEHKWIGHLLRTEGVLDTRTRVLFSVVQIEDPYGLYSSDQSDPLRIGTYVNAGIQGKTLNNVIILPRHTLQGNGTVWVTDQENRLRSRSVEVVIVNDDNAYISSGLEASDKVVITRLENPLNGMLVRISEIPGNGIQ